jgi:hypothetical protein
MQSKRKWRKTVPAQCTTRTKISKDHPLFPFDTYAFRKEKKILTHLMPVNSQIFDIKITASLKKPP